LTSKLFVEMRPTYSKHSVLCELLIVPFILWKAAAVAAAEVKAAKVSGEVVVVAAVVAAAVALWMSQPLFEVVVGAAAAAGHVGVQGPRPHRMLRQGKVTMCMEWMRTPTHD